MTIAEFIQSVTDNITNKTQKASINPPIVGGAFVDLANILDDFEDTMVVGNVLHLSGSTETIIQKPVFANQLTVNSAPSSNTDVVRLTDLSGFALDNTVVHSNGFNEDVHGSKSFKDFTSLSSFGMGDGSTQTANGNSWSLSQNSTWNAMRWVVPSANTGPTITFLKDGTNTLKFQLWNGSSDLNGGIFEFNGDVAFRVSPR